MSTSPQMTQGALLTALRRFSWKVIAPRTRVVVKSTLAKLVGAITRQRTQVEVFGSSGADKGRERFRVQLESVNANARTDLCRIMTSYGSDKGMGRHNYTTLYHHLFSPLRRKDISLFELGLGTNNPTLASTMGVTGKPGASLRGWSDYFPEGRIFGADIDRDILFNEGRIKTFYCDQLSPSAIAQMWAQPSLPKAFDILIEDGLHTFQANISFLENSLHKVRKGGYYIVEDVRQEDVPLWRKTLKTQYSVAHPEFSFSLVRLPWMFNNSDNILLVAHRH